MKPPPFEYHAPASLADALELLSVLGPEAKVLAGGQTLVPLLNFRLVQPSALVDLNRVAELAYVREAEGGIEVGAITRHRAVERSDIVAGRAPLLGAAMPHIAHPQIRNRGTIGGSLAHNDPSAELPAVLAALDGWVTLAGPGGRRTVKWDAFFAGILTTVVEPDEILTAVHFPDLAPGSGVAVLEVARRHGDFAMAGVAAAVTPGSGGDVSGARIALFGVHDGPLRAFAAETALRDRPASPELWREAGRLAASGLQPPTDVHATAEYRREMAEILVARALAAAWREVEGERAR